MFVDGNINAKKYEDILEVNCGLSQLVISLQMISSFRMTMRQFTGLDL